MDARIQNLIETLGLQPHPEGGYYRELFRSTCSVPYRGGHRSAVTSIQYLLSGAAYSAWHRIDADEIWLFHAGGALALHVWDAVGPSMTTMLLGDPRMHRDAQLQVLIPAGCWFSAELAARAGLGQSPGNQADYVLSGCVVAPGFEFSGFQLAAAIDMAPAVKQYGEWVRRLLPAPR